MMVLQMTKSAAQFEFEFVFGHVDIHFKRDLQGFWQDNISVYQPTRYEWEVANQLVAIRAIPFSTAMFSHASVSRLHVSRLTS